MFFRKYWCYSFWKLQISSTHKHSKVIFELMNSDVGSKLITNYHSWVTSDGNAWKAEFNGHRELSSLQCFCLIVSVQSIILFSFLLLLILVEIFLDFNKGRDWLNSINLAKNLFDYQLGRSINVNGFLLIMFDSWLCYYTLLICISIVKSNLWRSTSLIFSFTELIMTNSWHPVL